MPLLSLNRRALLIALLFCLLQPAAWAQYQPAGMPATPPPPLFSVRVNLVRLLVAAHDRRGAVLSNLNKDDFRIYDSGTAQPIAFFERNTSLPLSMAILIDTSASTIIDLHSEAESVLKFLPSLLGSGNPDDTFALFTFNWRINVEEDYSRNAKAADRVLRSLKGEGGTSLYDAIYLASGTLQNRTGRHVMVIVTDGGDTTSYKHYEDALTAAQRSDVVLYPIVMIPIAGDAGRNLGGEHALATLSNSTGGRIFYPESFQRLDQSFAEILSDLRTQYLLAYYPQGVPGQRGVYHPITVRTLREDIGIRTRTGYYQP